MTVVPLKIYFNEQGRAKVEVALAKGRKAHDKREGGEGAGLEPRQSPPDARSRLEPAMSVGPVIRRAGPVDAGRLGAAGPALYAESYAFLWDDDAAYAAQLATFGPDAFADLWPATMCACGSWRMMGAAWLPVAASRRAGARDGPVGRRRGAAHLSGAGSDRAGVGPRMLDEAAACARDEGAGYLWLDAMETAPWAVRTYQKWGFAEIGRMPFSRP